MSDSPKHLLLQIPFNKMVIISISIIYSFGLPFLAIYHLYPDFFKSCDTLKLILFCSSVGLLIYTINYILIFSYCWIKNEILALKQDKYALNENELYEITAISTIMYFTTYILIFLLAMLILSYTPNIFEFIRHVQGINLIFFVLTILWQLKKLNEEKNRVKKILKEDVNNTKQKLEYSKVKIEELEINLAEIEKEPNISGDAKIQFDKLNQDLKKVKNEYIKAQAIHNQITGKK